jgi:NAD(P)-dependent dehydrogenase (short-subunit alcohol dehydrogenase family)
LKKTGKVDAIVSSAGDVHFGELSEFTEEQFMYGFTQKVMGQINLVIHGTEYLNDHGSFTLTSAILNRDPVRLGIGAATANGALDGFVAGSAIQMPRGIRINVVSPGLLEISAPTYSSFFPGHEWVPSGRVGRAYARSVEGLMTGEVLIVD